MNENVQIGNVPPKAKQKTTNVTPVRGAWIKDGTDLIWVVDGLGARAAVWAEGKHCWRAQLWAHPDGFAYTLEETFTTAAQAKAAILQIDQQGNPEEETPQ